MAQHTARWVLLDRVIKEYISQSRLTSADYLRLYHLAFRGLEELSLDVSGTIKTRKLSINENKTVDLPVDYLQWIKAGILNNNGEVATLRHNRNLTNYGAIEANRTSINSGEGIPDQPCFYRNFQDGEMYFNLFGVPGGTQNLGEFKVDEDQCVILLKNSYAYDYIILEYLAAPQSDPDYLIPIQVKECLIAWLAWKDIATIPAGRRSNLGMIAERKHEYYRLKRLASRRLDPVRLSDLNDTIRLNSRISIKA